MNLYSYSGGTVLTDFEDQYTNFRVGRPVDFESLFELFRELQSNYEQLKEDLKRTEEEYEEKVQGLKDELDETEKNCERWEREADRLTEECEELRGELVLDGDGLTEKDRLIAELRKLTEGIVPSPAPKSRKKK